MRYTEIYLGDDTEETGNFGVFTETTPVNNSLAYADGYRPGVRVRNQCRARHPGTT